MDTEIGILYISQNIILFKFFLQPLKNSWLVSCTKTGLAGFWSLGHADLCSTSNIFIWKLNHYDIVGRALPLSLDLSFHLGSALNHVIVSKAFHLLQKACKIDQEWKWRIELNFWFPSFNLVSLQRQGRVVWALEPEFQDLDSGPWFSDWEQVI